MKKLHRDVAKLNRDMSNKVRTKLRLEKLQENLTRAKEGKQPTNEAPFDNSKGPKAWDAELSSPLQFQHAIPTGKTYREAREELHFLSCSVSLNWKWPCGHHMPSI